jgi:[ribosomal protein S18]-alanine N-acetyltransferase
MDIQIRNMEFRHVDDVVDIERGSFSDPWSKTLFFHELRTEYGRSFIAALDQGQRECIVGYICAWVVCDECTINKIAVHSDYRRTGIGSMLLRHLINDMRTKGVLLFTLDVRSSNSSAQLFYNKFGFVQTRVRKNYYTDTQENALILDLHMRENDAYETD